MTDEQSIFTANIIMRPLGAEPDPIVLTKGVEPYILITPDGGSDTSAVFSFDSTGISKEDAVKVLEAMAALLKETELNFIEEG